MLKVHTFEMSKEIRSNEERKQIFNNLKKIEYRRKVQSTYTSYRYYGKSDTGLIITVLLYKYSSRHKVCISINPSKVLKDEKEALFEINMERFFKCLEKVGEIMEECQFDINDFKISRVDFTGDIKFERSELIDTMIRLLHSTGTPNGYISTRYGKDIYKDTYDITREGLCSIVVYNKERQYKSREGENCELMDGVMRVEVRMNAEEFVQETFPVPDLFQMRGCAEQIIRDAFVSGFYVKLKMVKSILHEEFSRRSTTKRIRNKLQKMIQFAEGVAIHRTLSGYVHSGQFAWCHDTLKNVLREFEQRRINLVTISARTNVAIIPDIVYMLGIKPKSEMDKDVQFLIQNKLIEKLPAYTLR